MTLASLVAAPHEALFAPPSHLFTSVCGQTDAEIASVVAILALTIADTASPHVSRAIRNLGLLYPSLHRRIRKQHGSALVPLLVKALAKRAWLKLSRESISILITTLHSMSVFGIRNRFVPFELLEEDFSSTLSSLLEEEEVRARARKHRCLARKSANRLGQCSGTTSNRRVD